MTPNRFLHPACYLVVSLLILMVQVMPLGTTLANISGPDVFVALTCAWVWHRPAALPLWCVVVASLLFDLLLMRPPGLGTAFLIIAVEVLRARAFIPGEQSLALEWFNASVVIIGLMFVTTLATAMLFLSTGGLVLTLTQLALTVVIYPLVALCVMAVCSLIEPAKETSTL